MALSASSRAWSVGSARRPRTPEAAEEAVDIAPGKRPEPRLAEIDAEVGEAEDDASRLDGDPGQRALVPSGGRSRKAWSAWEDCGRFNQATERVGAQVDELTILIII